MSLELENGYRVLSYFRENGTSSWTNFESTFSLTPNVKYDFYFLIYFPDTISKDTIYNMSFEFHKKGLMQFGSGSADFYRPNSSNTYSFDNWTMEEVGTYTNRYYSSENMTATYDTDRMKFFFSATATDTGESSVLYPLTIEISEVSSSGLLGGIIEWIKSIWEGIKNLPGNIANAIKGFFDSIVTALTNLGNFIIDGIKNLFIPSEEDITKMKDQWDNLLADRFGALYQVVELISDYASSFTKQSKYTITFPSISIPLAGSTFEFGGWEVKVVPNGFSAVFESLKLITSVACTILFVNGMKKRFEKLMGGADDI